MSTMTLPRPTANLVQSATESRSSPPALDSSVFMAPICPLNEQKALRQPVRHRIICQGVVRVCAAYPHSAVPDAS